MRKFQAEWSYSIYLTLLIFSSFSLFAQKKDLIKYKLTLRDCINRAINNSNVLKQSKIQIAISDNILSRSKLSSYPSFNGSLSQYFTSGRNIDPFTNQYVEDKINYQNIGLNASVLVYGGGQQKNTLKINELGVLASEKDAKAIEEQLTVDVIVAFFRVLNDEEQLELAKKQLESTKFQLQRFEAQAREGVVSRSVVADLMAQLAGDELTISNSENTISISKSILIQYLNDSFLNTETLRLEKKEINLIDIASYKESMDRFVAIATTKQSAVGAAKIRTEMAQKTIDNAFASKYPSLWLYFGLGTNYSSAAPSQQFIGDGKVPKLVENKLRDYVMVNGQQQNLIRVSEVSSGTYRSFGYLNQLGFNLSNSLGFSLKIPIFNGLSTKYSVENAYNYRKVAELQLKNTELQIKNSLENAYKNASSAHKRLSLTQKQLTATETAFRFVNTRFEEGIISSTEYTLAKSNLERIISSYTQTKYEYLFRVTLLEFYLGRL